MFWDIIFYAFVFMIAYYFFDWAYVLQVLHKRLHKWLNHDVVCADCGKIKHI